MALKSFNCQGKTGLGPFAAVLQSLCLHTSLLQQNTKTTGLKITICTTVGANSEPQETKTKNTQMPFLKSREQKSGYWEQKQGSVHAPLHSTPQKGRQTT